MPSSINTTSSGAFIDTFYPKQGQDNPSQGFRDNFTSIVTNFTAASNDIGNLQVSVGSILGSTGNLILFGAQVGTNANNISVLQGNVSTIDSEITVLQGNVAVIQGNINTFQANAVLTSNALNQMGGNVIAGATGSVVSNITTGSNTLTLDYAAGDFQVANITISPSLVVFSQWPAAGVYAKINALITMTAGNVVIFPAQVALGSAAHGIGTVGNIASVQSRITDELTAIATGNYWFEFATVDGGVTVLVTEKSHP